MKTFKFELTVNVKDEVFDKYNSYQREIATSTGSRLPSFESSTIDGLEQFLIHEIHADSVRVKSVR